MTELDTYRGAHELVTQDLISAWLEYERQEGQSANTLDAYRKGLDVFAAWLRENGEPDPVTPEHVRAFKADLAERYAAQTVNLRLSAVRSFYRFCVTTGRMPLNPASEIKGAKRPKSRTHKRDALSNGEVLAVLDTCDPGTLEGTRDRAMLTLFAYCGLRAVEVYRANIGDLVMAGERLALRVQGKGRKEKDEKVYVPKAQEGTIRAWLAHRMTFRAHGAGDPLFVGIGNRNRGGRLSLRAIRKTVKARYRLAGVVGDKSTHSLRHSAITSAIRHGGTPLQVQAMARHSSFDTTLGYYHETARVDNPAEDLIAYQVEGGRQ